MKGCRVLNQKEVNKIINALSQRDRVMVLVCLTFGTRISETLSLKFGDFLGDFLEVKSKKKSHNTTFPIPVELKQEIKALKKEYEKKGIEVTSSTMLFLSRKGKNKAITRIHASRIISALVKKMGISGKVNTHSFRKTFVTEIYRKTNFDIIMTKKYSRHKSLGNLEYYIETAKNLDLVCNFTWIHNPVHKTGISFMLKK